MHSHRSQVLDFLSCFLELCTGMAEKHLVSMVAALTKLVGVVWADLAIHHNLQRHQLRGLEIGSRRHYGPIVMQGICVAAYHAGLVALGTGTVDCR